MSLLDRFRRKESSEVDEGVEPPPPSTAAEFVALGDWDAVAAFGAEGREATVAELDRLAAVDHERFRLDLEPLPAEQVGPVVEAVAAMRDPGALDALARAAATVRRADAPLTGALFDAFVADGSATAIDVLVAIALDRWDSRAGRAAAALATLPLDQVVPRVTERFDDRDREARVGAVSLVARVAGPDDALEVLLPLLGDDAADVRERVAERLAETGDVRAVLPLLIAEESERRTTRAGFSAVTFSGRPSAYLRAASQILADEPRETWAWDLDRQLPYEAEATLERTLASVVDARSADVLAATENLAVRSPAPWTVSSIASLLERSGVSRHGRTDAELQYLDARRFVTDRDRCRRLGLSVSESSGESHATVYGEKVDWVATVTCDDGTLRLVADQESVHQLERSP
ncbi:MAG: HEAT repeat domain-containing protein [Acidimicrobiia bacterium]